MKPEHRAAIEAFGQGLIDEGLKSESEIERLEGAAGGAAVFVALSVCDALDRIAEAFDRMVPPPG